MLISDSGESGGGSIAKRVSKKRRKLSGLLSGDAPPATPLAVITLDEDAKDAAPVSASQPPVPLSPPRVSMPCDAATDTPQKGAETVSLGMDYASSPFVPAWNLVNGSRLFVRTSALEFSRYAFPPGSVAEMESLGSAQLADEMRLAAARSALCLSTGAQRMSDAYAHVRELEIRNRELQRQLGVLEKEKGKFDQKLERVFAEKMIVEEKMVVLDGKLEKAERSNESLSIRVESLERDLVEKSEALAVRSDELNGTKADLSWLIQHGIAGVVDRIFESRAFTEAFRKVKESCWAAGAFSGGQLARKEAGVAVESIEADSNTSSLMNEAIDNFASLDYFSLLGVDGLDLAGIRALCPSEEETEEKSVGDGGAGAGPAAVECVGDSGDDEKLDGGGAATSGPAGGVPGV